MHKLFGISVTAGLSLWVASAGAVDVRGTVVVEPKPIDPTGTPRVAGYIRSRITAPSRSFRTRDPEYALFLEVKSSLPLPERDDTFQVLVRGFQFEPQVSSCAVDDTLTFVNQDLRDRVVKVGDAEIPVPAGGTAQYTCQAGASGAELKRITLAEHPYARGFVYVGEVGVPGRLDASGNFSLSAVKGTYELLLIDATGVVARKPVEVDTRSVNVDQWTPEDG